MKHAKPKIGDELEIGIWVSDDEPLGKILWWKSDEAPRRLHESAEMYGLRHGEITWHELKPGEGRAGHPPKTIKGTNVRLLVAEAKLVSEILAPLPKSFLHDLGIKDLETLRTATRRAYHPTELTDEQCDKVIEHIGPSVAEQMLSQAIHGRAN